MIEQVLGSASVTEVSLPLPSLFFSHTQFKIKSFCNRLKILFLKD
jgi:uncharacterized membrane protein